MGTIALLTDFGNRDGYAGVMKGVIRGINPTVDIVDLSHEIAPQDIPSACFVLYAHYRFFPQGTIFVIVVDPEVGTERRPLIVQTERYYFVTPDNGSLSYVLPQEKIKKCVHVKNQAFFLKKVSYSFHGRDVFSPTAAHLSLGKKLTEFGPTVSPKSIVSWSFPKAKLTRAGITGCIIYVDRFGNLMTNITEQEVVRLPKGATVSVKGEMLGALSRTYADRRPGEFLSFISSGGLLEIAQNMGSAASSLKAGFGDEVWIQTIGVKK